MESEFQINSERIKNLGRLKSAVAFSLFRDLQLNEPALNNKKYVKSDYKVYDLNNRVIFYVSSTTAISITKDGPFCLKLMNKDQRTVAKLLRNEPRSAKKSMGLLSMFACCSTNGTRDEMEILDDNGNLIAICVLNNNPIGGTEIVVRNIDDKEIMRVKNSKEQKLQEDLFVVYDQQNRFLGEIRPKIISSGNSTDNYKGVSCWFSNDVPVDYKLLFLGAAFLIEIDYLSEKISRQTPFHQPVTDYLNPIIRTPPYHDRFRNVTKNTKMVKKKKKIPKISDISKTVSTTKDKKENLVMPQIHHTKHFAPIGSNIENTENNETKEKEKPVELSIAKEEMDTNGMTREQFRNAGKKILDYLVRQDENLNTARCTPTVKLGYLRSLLPVKAPMQPEDIDEILEDYHQLIVPGLSHSSHPKFHSFYPSGNAFHCLLADLLGGHTGDASFYWTANPALTELEQTVMDWLGDMMGLPKDFLLYPEVGRGGGCMLRSACDSNFLVMAAARTEMIKKMKKERPKERTADILTKLVAYTSIDAHMSIKKAALAAMVKLRVLPTDENYSLRSETLQIAISTDIQKGLIPFFVAATFGTTGPCSFDSLHDLGPICHEYGIWLHVDAAYAGTALVCPETRALMRGIDWAESFSTTPSKMLFAVCDVCCLWVRDRYKLQQASMEYQSDMSIKGKQTSQRVGALKMWFLLRSLGVENLQKQIREHIRLGKYMEQKLRSEKMFEVCNRVHLGLICFRIRGSNNFTKTVLFNLNETGKINLASCTLNNNFAIRLCINSPRCTETDLDESFKLIYDETMHLKPFEEKINTMTDEDLDGFFKTPYKSFDDYTKIKRNDVSLRLNVSNPMVAVSSKSKTRIVKSDNDEESVKTARSNSKSERH